MDKENLGFSIQVGQSDILPGSIKQRHLVPSVVRKGDLYFGLNGGNFSSIEIGATGQILAVEDGLPAWVNATGPSGPAGPSFPYVESNTSSAAPAPSAITNFFELSAQTATAAFGVPTTPGNGRSLRVIITSSNSATARAITWNTATGGYTGNATPLPSANTTGKSMIADFVYLAHTTPPMHKLISSVTGA